MACLQIARSGLSLALGLRPAPLRRRFSGPGALRLRCRLQDRDGDSKGEEPAESLFMKELKRRGMTPTSLLEDGGRDFYGPGEKEMEMEIEMEEESGSSKSKPKRKGVVSTEYDEGLFNQRERSMALNSEGLEGLIPRAKVLLTIGGTFFLGFWPLILITIAIFTALYLYFGPSFVHDGSELPISPPPYIDPYALMKDERLSEIAPHVN